MEQGLRDRSKARDLVQTALELRNQGEFKRAIAKLGEARNLDPCDSTVAAIDKAITAISNEMAEAEAAKAEAALEACQFRESRTLIAALPEGERRQGLVERWNKSYETERKARDLVQEAMGLKQQGQRSRAIGKLHEARDLDPCDSTVAAIDRAIADMGPDQAAANAWCQNNPKLGAGYYAGNFQPDGSFYCLPTKATADAWCRRNNRGAGWRAGTIRSTGSYDCRQSEQGQRAAAEADCRKQHGSRLIRAFKSGGRWRCEYKTDRMVAEEDCRRQHGDRLIRVFKSGGRWRCEYRTGGTQGPGSGRCPPDHILMDNGKCLDRGFLRGIGKNLQGIGKNLGPGGVRGTFGR